MLKISEVGFKVKTLGRVFSSLSIHKELRGFGVFLENLSGHMHAGVASTMAWRVVPLPPTANGRRLEPHTVVHGAPHHSVAAAQAGPALLWQIRPQMPWTDLPQLLCDLELEMHSNLMLSQEIDIDLLLEFGETDLKQLGIWSFGHRRNCCSRSCLFNDATPFSKTICSKKDVKGICAAINNALRLFFLPVS